VGSSGIGWSSEQPLAVAAYAGLTSLLTEQLTSFCDTSSICISTLRTPSLINKI
jgi:hypothetical protein